MTATEIPQTAADLRAEARETYRQSVAAEMPLSGSRLGEMFGRSARWGRERIAEVRAEDAERHAAAAGGMPAAAGGMPAAGAGTPVAEVAAEAGMPAAEAGTPVAEVAAEAGMPVAEAGMPAAEPVAVAEVAEPGGMPVAETGMPVAVERKSEGRWVAWVAFVLGIVASVAANVMHAREVTSDRPEAAVAAAFWPLALLLAVEVLTRVRWPRGGWYAVARYGGTGIVAAVAAVMSYRHMAGLLARWGEDSLNSSIGPLAVDGLMVVAAAALLAMSPKEREREVNAHELGTEDGSGDGT